MSNERALSTDNHAPVAFCCFLSPSHKNWIIYYTIWISQSTELQFEKHSWLLVFKIFLFCLTESITKRLQWLKVSCGIQREEQTQLNRKVPILSGNLFITHYCCLARQWVAVRKHPPANPAMVSYFCSAYLLSPDCDDSAPWDESDMRTDDTIVLIKHR